MDRAGEEGGEVEENLNPGRCCDECGSSEIYYGAWDLIEIDPVPDKKGVLWARWEVVPGSDRFGCKEHPVKPGRLIRKGTDEYERTINQLRDHADEAARMGY